MSEGKRRARGQFMPKATRLMDQVHETLRYHHYAFRTEQSYVSWILRFIRFNDKQHPKDMGKDEIERFLSHLALNRDVAASTQNQALNAIIFLYEEVLHKPINGISPVRTKKNKNVPTVMSLDETKAALNSMHGTHKLMARFMYVGGLRLMEVIRARIHDFDFDNEKFLVRDGKGGKSRTTFFPKQIHRPFHSHFSRVKELHEKDLAQGFGSVYLPHALARKYPGAATSWGWQYAFPASNLSKDPRSGETRRHHTHHSGLQKAVAQARKEANLTKRISCHTFRHSFATHMLEDGVNIRKLQVLLGHNDVKTTEIYTHVMNNDIRDIKTPLLALEDDE